MANKISLSAIQNAFLKRLIWKRYRNRIPENEQTRVRIEQFLLRIKIDSGIKVSILTKRSILQDLISPKWLPGMTWSPSLGSRATSSNFYALKL